MKNALISKKNVPTVNMGRGSRDFDELPKSMPRSKLFIFNIYVQTDMVIMSRKFSECGTLYCKSGSLPYFPS